MKLLKNNCGIAHLAVLLVISAAAVGFVGWASWNAWQANRKDYETVQPAKKESTEEPSTIPEGYLEYKNKELGFSFAYPKSWQKVITDDPKYDFLFHVGTMSPDFREDEVPIGGTEVKQGAKVEIYIYETDIQDPAKVDEPSDLNGHFKSYIKSTIGGVSTFEGENNYEGDSPYHVKFIKNGYLFRLNFDGETTMDEKESSLYSTFEKMRKTFRFIE